MGKDDEGTAEFKKTISGKKTALAGPSGVGKSTILNRLIPHAQAETGDISQNRAGKTYDKTYGTVYDK